MTRCIDRTEISDARDEDKWSWEGKMRQVANAGDKPVSMGGGDYLR